jgi:hypothetical protein
MFGVCSAWHYATAKSTPPAAAAAADKTQLEALRRLSSKDIEVIRTELTVLGNQVATLTKAKPAPTKDDLAALHKELRELSAAEKSDVDAVRKVGWCNIVPETLVESSWFPRLTESVGWGGAM